MTALWIILGVIFFFGILLMLALGIRIQYDGENFRFLLRYGFITVYDSAKPKKEKKPKKEAPAASEKKDSPSLLQVLSERLGLDFQKGAKGVLPAVKKICSLLSALCEKTGKLVKHFRVDELTLGAVIADREPDAAALTYGKVCAIAYPALALAQSCLKIQTLNANIDCSYEQEKSTLSFTLRFHVKLLWCVGFLLSCLGIYLKQRKQGKK